MTLQQLWTRGAFVRVPSGATGMVRAFDRRTNMVTVRRIAFGTADAPYQSNIQRTRAEQTDDFVALLREKGIVQDHHFTTLRPGEQP